MSEVRLRPTRPDDLPFVMEAERDPEARPFISNSTLDEHLAALGGVDTQHLIIESDGERAGFAMLAGLTDASDNVEVSRLVVTARGRGVGQRALPLVIDHVFATTAAHRLWLDVLPHNARARRVYEATGFIEEGTLREAWVGPNGRESLVILSVLRAEWAATRA